MGNLTKGAIFLTLLLLAALTMANKYFTSETPITEEPSRPFTTPSLKPNIYPIEKLPKLTSDSKEIVGSLAESCNPEYLSITDINIEDEEGVTYQFKTVDSIKNIYLGKGVIIANISASTTEEKCGTTVKLGSVKDFYDNLFILGRTVCFPPANHLYKDECSLGLKSEAGDYYTMDSIPVLTDSTERISNFDLILVSGTLDLKPKYVYPGQKGSIFITETKLITQNAYK